LWELIRHMTRLTQKQFNMEYTVIKNEKQYNKAINRLEQIFDAKKSTREGDELELLSLLIDKYEQEKYPIDFPDPIDAIKFRMEQLGYQQKDLVSAIGLKSRVSEIFSRKRRKANSTKVFTYRPSI